jgi:hypothetical protein
MALISILARRQEVRRRMVSKYVSSLLVRATIFTIGYHMLGDTLHIRHTAQASYRILNKEVLGVKSLY